MSRLPQPRSHVPPRSRKAFWLFVVVMALAIAGGGLVAALGRRNVAARKGHPDTVAPAAKPGRAAPAAPAPGSPPSGPGAPGRSP